MEKVKVENIVDELNNCMEIRGSVIRFKYRSEYYKIIDIYIDDVYISSSIINLTKDFYKDLEEYFDKGYGIKGISYNNTRSCFWHEDIQ